MNLIDELGRLEKSLSEYRMHSGVFTFTNQTPAFDLTNYVISINGDMLIVITRRGNSETRFTDAFIAAAISFGRGLIVPNPISCHSIRIGLFTKFCIIAPTAHNMFATYSPNLKQRTLVAFPAYLCEFAGDESPEMIKLLRRDFIDTIDWGRNPSPQFRLRYDNRTRGVGSDGAELGFASVEALNDALSGINGCTGFIDIENYRRNRVRIEAQANKYTWTLYGHSPVQLISYAEMIGKSRSFVFDGVAA